MTSAEKLIIVFSLFQAVLCREFSISLPQSVEALRGLCVLIPCSFDIKKYDADLQGDPTGIWMKDDHKTNKVFDSKVIEENKIEGKILGDLRMKNCTTIFYNIRKNYSGRYYFRLETSGPLKYTYTPSVSVRVRDSPIRPSIRLYKEDQGEVEDHNEVVEGTSVRLICSAPAPLCLLKPPSFTWNFLPKKKRQEQNHDTSFSSSQLNFSATHLHHGLNFTCTATYWFQDEISRSAKSSLTLHVLYGPKNTSVSASPSAPVVLGSSVSLSCSSDANPAVLNYTWYRENGEQIGTGNHLTISTTDSTHSGLYYCRAQNQHGDQRASVYLDVQYAPQVSPSSSCNNSMGFFNCSCEVHGNPLPKLLWRFSGQPVSPSQVISTWEESASNTTLRSFVSIRPSANDTHTLQCVSTNSLGVTSQVFYYMNKTPCSAGVSGVNVSSMLIGVAAGASVMMMLCGIFLCVRKVIPSQSGRGDTAALGNAVCQEEDEETAYVSKTVLSELLHYSNIVFPNGDGSEIRGLSKLTADYATIHHSTEQHTHRGVTETDVEDVEQENVNVDSEKMQEQEATYGNITRQPMLEQTQFDLGEDDDNGIEHPQVQ